MRTGGRETYTIQINETAGKTLEGTSVNTDPFDGNKCGDEKCVPSRNSKNKISCRKNDTYAIESQNILPELPEGWTTCRVQMSLLIWKVLPTMANLQRRKRARV